MRVTAAAAIDELVSINFAVNNQKPFFILWRILKGPTRMNLVYANRFERFFISTFIERNDELMLVNNTSQ